MREINKILYNASVVILVLFPKLSKSYWDFDAKV